MLVYNVSRDDQKTFFSTLEALSQHTYSFPTPVIIVVGDVVSLKKYAQEISKPNILVTGTQKEHFETLGKVIHQPLIEITRTSETGLLQKINDLKQFDWLFFTSRYSVKFFFETLRNAGKDSRYLHHLQIASVGRVTSEALKTEGILPDLQPADESSEGLLQLMQEKGIQPGKVFIPRSELGLPVIPVGLKALGWEVETFATYTNKMPENTVALDLEDIEQIMFSSPSCVTNFLKLYGAFPANIEFIFRGKETEKRFNQLKN